MKILKYLVLLWVRHCYADNAVKYAAVLFRHGDRTPVDFYPTDPWKNESLWPVKIGELTNTGVKQHYELGKWLRQRYSHLISEKFDPTEVRVISSDVDRTLMSAEANLAGMYPPVGSSIWNEKLLWQPIPIHTRLEGNDEIIAMDKNCPTYNEEMKKMQQSEDYINRLKKYKSLMDYMTLYTKTKIEDYYDILKIYSTLYIENLYNFTLPGWTTQVYPKRMREPACYSFSVSAATPLLARLKGGPLLKDIFSHINNAITEVHALKLTIYSGHDLTVGTLLTALGMFDGNCPVYTASIIIELLHEPGGLIYTEGTYYIRILYRNSTEIVEPHILRIPNCGQVCPLDKFKELYKNLLTVNFDRECKENMAISSAAFILFMVVTVIAVAASCMCSKKDTKSPQPEVVIGASESLIKTRSTNKAII